MYYCITDVFAKTFGRNATLPIDRARDEIVKTIEDEKEKEAYTFRKSIGYLFSKGGLYANLFNPNWFSNLRRFIEFFSEEKVFKHNTSKLRCVLCSGGHFEVEPIDATQMSIVIDPNIYLGT